MVVSNLLVSSQGVLVDHAERGMRRALMRYHCIVVVAVVVAGSGTLIRCLLRFLVGLGSEENHTDAAQGL